jgi:hypothetical protein
VLVVLPVGQANLFSPWMRIYVTMAVVGAHLRQALKFTYVRKHQSTPTNPHEYYVMKVFEASSYLVLPRRRRCTNIDNLWWLRPLSYAHSLHIHERTSIHKYSSLNTLLALARRHSRGLQYSPHVRLVCSDSTPSATPPKGEQNT